MKKETLAGAGLQSVQLHLNRSDGHSLHKIYYAAYGTENINTMYDHNNKAGAKYTSLYTNLDNQKVQDFDINVAQNEDWLVMQDKCVGSLISSVDVFRQNAVYIENFSNTLSPADRPKYYSDENLVSGLSLKDDYLWNVNITAVPATALNHYVYTVCYKTLTINSSGVALV